MAEEGEEGEAWLETEVSRRSEAKTGSWQVSSWHTPIASIPERERAQAASGARELPEMLFWSGLFLSDSTSGTVIRLSTLDALSEWAREQLAPPSVRVAAEWREGHRRRFGDGCHPCIGYMRSDDPSEQSLDWTFTTPYRGSVDCTSGSFRPADKACPDERVNRELLSRRDPILLFDEVTLYESELDDAGVSSLHYKVRVMPRCWYVLLRFWLRIDHVLLRVRETRIFCELGTDKIIREHSRLQKSFDELKDAGLSAHPAQYRDADAAVRTLVDTFGWQSTNTEVLELNNSDTESSGKV